MLGVDAIVMLYHCAKVSVGHILEVGSCVGGAIHRHGHGRPRFRHRKENHQHRARSARGVQPAHYREILPLSAILDPHH